MILPKGINYRDPDYSEVFDKRGRKLEKLRTEPELLEKVKVYYQTHPWDFISDWGMTYEPRNIERGLPPFIPFVLWPRQKEFVQWIYQRWKAQERGMGEKSRDCGVTWLCVGFAVSMWLFEDGFSTGFGSRKEDLVDLRGDDKSIFEKIRTFIDRTPKEFKPKGFNAWTHSAHMRITNPENGASIIGEAGDQIGRGGRTSIYIVDEAAFVEHQETVDRALSQNTNCQIDISTPNGNGNQFYKKRQRFNNTDRLFIFDWKDDPRKDDAWYQKQKEEQDEVTVAQEIDRDYNASQEDAFIPAKWVVAAIDAHIKLGFRGEGLRSTGFDPADVGDAKAVVNRHGSIIKQAKQMTQGDITQAIPWAFEIADDFRADYMIYDGDGMGAPTMKIALTRMAATRMKVIAYHGSAGVVDPTKPIHLVKREHKQFREGTKNLQEKSVKTNTDTYLNFRSQTWTWIRDRFEATYIAVQRAEQGLLVNVDPEDLISIDSSCECLTELQAELSRPMRIYTPNGKIKVESKPDMKKRGVDSPNLADAAVIAMSVKRADKGEDTFRQNMKFRRHRINDPGVGY